MTHDLALTGCVPTVLAGYLKALAVHRLVAEGPDPSAASYWSDEATFHIVSILDRDALCDFFLRDYAPTPLVTPWNGGSGFYTGDQQAGIAAIESSTAVRFAAYRDAIGACRRLLAELGLTEKPSKEDKPRLLRLARARFSDDVLAWLDAAFAIGDEARYPALLGTGGNDGRLDFANNFMQRLAEMFLREGAETGPAAKRGDPSSRLAAALFAERAAHVFESAAVGQFAPGLAGGPNMTAGPEAEARVNPWDFVLALEGTLVFAGAAVRRLAAGARGSASFPFHVRASGVGYGSSADSDEPSARSELWLPLWSNKTAMPELRMLFGEGRLEVSGQPAESGLDAAHALASLGIDRGIDRFQRVGILRRNGLAYLASHLGTFRVRHVPEVDLLRDPQLRCFLEDVERWVGTGRAQPAISAALRATRTAMFDASRPGVQLTAVLAGLGALERAVSRSAAARENIRRPLGGLSAGWFGAADDESPEFRLAAALASWQPGVRPELEPVDGGGAWTDASRTSGGDPFASVVAIAQRRLMQASTGRVPFEGAPVLTARALYALLEGQVDRMRFADLVFGLALLPFIPRLDRPVERVPWTISSAFCMLRAVASPVFLAEAGLHPAPKSIGAILARLRAADPSAAVEIAARRLIASGCHLLVPSEALRPVRVVSPGGLEAVAAALVLPLPHTLDLELARRVALRPADLEAAPLGPRPLETEGEPA